MNLKHRRWILYIVLIALLLVLTGCGIGGGGVDVTQVDPDGLWQTIVVWPMAKSLLAIERTLESFNTPYPWGFAIIVFTLAVKIITFPLTLMQIRGMEAQKKLQPKIQELQKKFGNDREKMAAAQMELYKEAGTNPLSGCLPLFVQMPILFGLYSSIIVLGDRLKGADFFWLPDLGFPEYSGGLAWMSQYFSDGEYGKLAAYIVLPLFLMISQFITQRWMTPPADPSNPQAGMMKQMTTMMTLMFGYFALTVPSGLSLYWVTSNILQLAQQMVITGQRIPIPGLGGNNELATATAGSISTNGLDASNIQADTSTSSTNGAAEVKAKPKSNRPKKRKAKRRK